MSLKSIEHLTSDDILYFEIYDMSEKKDVKSMSCLVLNGLNVMRVNHSKEVVLNILLSKIPSLMTFENKEIYVNLDHFNYINNQTDSGYSIAFSRKGKEDSSFGCTIYETSYEKIIEKLYKNKNVKLIEFHSANKGINIINYNKISAISESETQDSIKFDGDFSELVCTRSWLGSLTFSEALREFLKANAIMDEL